MNGRKKLVAGLSLVVLMCCARPIRARPVVSFSDGVLTIRTERYELSWRNGSMTSLTSLLPKRAELTVTPGPMPVGALPNGPGSFFGHEKEGHAQHYPWGFFPLSTTFPAQHPPCEDSRVGFEELPDGARLTYSGLKGDEGAVLVQQLTVDEETGDLVIRQEAKSPNPGLFGICFSILNLRPDIEFAVPYFGGQRWGREFGKDRIVTITWPEFWNAGLVVGRIPEGGTFAVWSEDEKMRPKYLRRYNAAYAQAIGFEACEDAPYGDRTQIEVFAWRFNTFGGSWMEPAGRYKEWMIKAYRLVPRRKRSPAWVNDIALMWPTYISEDRMRKMKEIVEPRHVLMMNWGWLKGFNRRIPEYIPQQENYAEKVALAHKYGYRVGVYTSMALVDRKTHPNMMRKYGLQLYYDALTGEKPDKPKGWLVYVHPGSAKWREFYAARMAEVVEKYGVDYLYQDVAGCGKGSQGTVGGKTFSAAVVACEDAIRHRLPQVAIGGEFWTEVNACREDFAVQDFLAWGGPEQGGKAHGEFIARPDQPHPILSYLFSDYCIYWSYKTPMRSTRRFHMDQNMREVIGAIPSWNGGAEDRTGEARLVIERARLWAEGFRPYFPHEWAPQAVSYLRNERGEVVKYVRKGASTYCYRETPGGDRLVYGRVNGLKAVNISSPVTIDGWIAYDDEGPVGLNPARWYCVLPGEPSELPLAIAKLPPGTWIDGVRQTADYCLVEVGGSGTGTVAWRTEKRPLALYTPEGSHPGDIRQLSISAPTSLVFAFARPQRPAAGTPLPLDTWKHYIVSDGRIVSTGALDRKGRFTFGAETHYAFVVHPPQGGEGSEYSIDGLIRIPEGSNVALKANLGRFGGGGDGVHFVVRINGREIWRMFSPSERGWQEVSIPLGEYAGKNVLLSLAVDCGEGGFNLSNDHSLWGDPRITAASPR